MSDYRTRLKELVDDLHGDAGRLERQGRALSDAETRRVAALRYAAELVQRAAELLAEAEAEAEPPEVSQTGSAAHVDSAAPPEPGWGREVYRDNAVGMSGDDDTPGYDRIRGPE